MNPAGSPHLSRKLAAGALVAALAGIISIAASLYAQQSTVALGKTRSMAETQHEIVMLLIKQKEYQKAAVEAHKIFEMKWPEDQEPVLLRELLLISEQFVRNGQAPLSLQFVDKNSKCFKKTESRIAILKEMGYLNKMMNQNDKAIEYFRKARELEED